jgi:site-specific DNA-methyltransferase (adenine-specific)
LSLPFIWRICLEEYHTISDAAKRIGVNPETLRRWDKSGKFSPKRHPINNYRVYSTKQIDKIIRETGTQHTIFQKPLQSPPFLSTELGTLYKEEALPFLRSIDSNSVRLVFADPPYNIKKAEWDTFESQQKYVQWSLEWIEEVYRILDSIGSLYICGFSEILADVKWAASHLFKGCKWIVWYYRNKANLANDWGRSHESILHFRKNKKFILNTDAVRVPYNAHTLKYPRHPQAETSQYGNGKQHVWTPNPNGAKPKDVLEIPTLSNNSWERMAHPTQKPVELLRKCVLASSNPGDLIVDPFGGSGTTYAVSEAFNRKWLGCEPNAGYCKIIRKRLHDKAHIMRIAQGTDEHEARKRRQRLRG